MWLDLFSSAIIHENLTTVKQPVSLGWYVNRQKQDRELVVDNFIRSILNSSRATKRIITLFIDSLFIVSAFWLALIVRLDSMAPLVRPITGCYLLCLYLPHYLPLLI